MTNQSSKSFARGAILAALSALCLSAISYYPRSEPITPYSKVRLLTDPAASISRVPGIGAATAANIIKFREEQGITSLRDLDKVRGMGEQRLAAAREFMELN
ncbi:MAG: helix-hairpin-helix domain-containing protein [Phycisphaerae bacterium]|jgi:DNA uptake protein ComE-like DNA-binding protein